MYHVLSLPDIHIFMLPSMRIFIRREPVSYAASDLLSILRKPVTRRALNMQMERSANEANDDVMLIEAPSKWTPPGITSPIKHHELSRVSSHFAAGASSPAELDMLTRMAMSNAGYNNRRYAISCYYYN